MNFRVEQQRSGTLRKVNKKVCNWVWNSQAAQRRESAELWKEQNLALDIQLAPGAPPSPLQEHVQDIIALSLVNIHTL